MHDLKNRPLLFYSIPLIHLYTSGIFRLWRRRDGERSSPAGNTVDGLNLPFGYVTSDIRILIASGNAVVSFLTICHKNTFIYNEVDRVKKCYRVLASYSVYPRTVTMDDCAERNRINDLKHDLVFFLAHDVPVLRGFRGLMTHSP